MVEEKPWYASKTIWGSLISVAAALATTVGIGIDQTTQGEIAEAMVQLVGAAGALFAIYGRLTATDIIA
jgi:hypothetical protein